MKKILSIIICTGLVLSSVAFSGFASDYENHWAKNEISTLLSSDVLSGDLEGNLRPDDNILRCEFIKVINRYYGFSKKASSNFSDVDSSKWYGDEFLIAKEQGYIAGDQNGFANPEMPITRAEVCVIMARLLKLEDNNQLTFTDSDMIPDWAKGAIGAMSYKGIVSGYENGEFKAENNITRAEAFSVITRTDKNDVSDDAKNVEDNKTENTDNPISNIGGISGSVSISGGGSGSSGGGGGSSRPTGTLSPASFELIKFDETTGDLQFEARYASAFNLKVDVVSAYQGNISPEPEKNFNFNSISYSSLDGDIYTFNIKEQLNSIVRTRVANNETYAVSLQVIAQTGRQSTGYNEFYNGVYSIDIPIPQGLNSVYAENGNKDKFKISWSSVENIEGYKYTVYNIDNDEVVDSKELTDTYDVIDINNYTVGKENLAFAVQTKVDGIYSADSERKTVTLNTPEFVSVVYDDAKDVYKVTISHSDEGAKYIYKIGDSELLSNTDLKDVELTIPKGTITKNNIPSSIEVKAVTDYNESIYAVYSYDFTYAGGAGTEESPYYIADSYQFENISTKPAAYFKQTADFTLPSSYVPNQTTFTGMYDGNNKTINYPQNFAVTADKFGLFYSLDGAKISNLTVDGAINGGNYQLIAGFAYTTANDTTFSNCTNSTNITSSKGNIGGFLADNKPATFISCTNEGNITSASSIVGGFAARGQDGVVFTSCTNTGNIQGTENVGGFQGYGGATYTSCINKGNITATKDSGAIAGGLLAALGKVSSFENCANLGNVSASRSSGGIVGGMASANTLTITASYNKGKITVTGSDNVEAGGMVGRGFYHGTNTSSRSTTITIKDCYNAGTFSASVAGSAVGIADQTRPSGAPTVYTHKITNFYDAINSDIDIIGAQAKNSDASVTSITVNNAFTLSDSAIYGTTKLAVDLKVIPDGFSEEIWKVSEDVNYPYIQLKNNP